ncbi:hypothetical protein AMTR_s00068p00115190 [Amborella trichopoda]|uniref:Uncharacterized protein n=1 Tax=Amborella trichopoda TaxID=13333 RepID=U5D498_AMBTC|nr:hypothetical protein AMTR_s00068p00115190 [Amborella trichopoda]
MQAVTECGRFNFVRGGEEWAISLTYGDSFAVVELGIMESSMVHGSHVDEVPKCREGTINSGGGLGVWDGDEGVNLAEREGGVGKAGEEVKWRLGGRTGCRVMGIHGRNTAQGKVRKEGMPPSPGKRGGVGFIEPSA